MHSYTVDGLPTLKIQTLTQDNISEHKRCNTLPVSLQETSPRPLHIREIDQAFPKVNYAQIRLEDDEVSNDECTDIIVKPVLIWRPGRRKQSHAQALPHVTADEQDIGAQEQDRRSSNIKQSSLVDLQSSDIIMKGTSADTIEQGANAIAKGAPSNTIAKGASNVTSQSDGALYTSACKSKSSLKVFKTNLTDALPPCNKVPKKVRFTCIRSCLQLLATVGPL